MLRPEQNSNRAHDRETHASSYVSRIDLIEKNCGSLLLTCQSKCFYLSKQGLQNVQPVHNINGTINSDVVNIGLNGAVDGDVRCKSLQIKGSFVGTARCDELIISGKARVSGRIAYGSLSVQRGATIEGDLIQSS